MKFDVITIFPEMIGAYINESILKRAQKNKLLNIKIHNLRDFAKDKHKKVDDRPFGGGPGMVLKIEPIIKAISKIKTQSVKKKTTVILFNANGKQFDEKMAQKLAKEEQLVMICGRYEGIDGRVKKAIKDLGLKVEEISIGPYVLTGGELPAMVLIDSISRKINGVLGKNESLEEKRLGVGVLTYTRPAEVCFNKKIYKVPKVLLSGDHAKIEKWKKSRLRGKN